MMLFSFWSLLFLIGLVLAVPVPVPDPSPEQPQLMKRETALNTLMASLVLYLPVLGASISSVGGILSELEKFLAFVTGAQTTYNELGGDCNEYTLIFARGTTEPGNVGIFAGPPFIDALRSLLGESSLVVQGVNNYTASVDGYFEGGEPSGAAYMASTIESVKATCPNTRLIAAGYSQGGQIVHNAAKLLPVETAEWISSVVIFGDPDNGTPVANVPASKTKVFCGIGDNICIDGDLVLPVHVLYGEDAVNAAAFVAAAAAAEGDIIN